MIHPILYLFRQFLLIGIPYYCVAGLPLQFLTSAYLTHKAQFNYFETNFQNCQFEFSNCLNDTSNVYNSLYSGKSIIVSPENATKGFFAGSTFYNGIKFDNCTITNKIDKSITIEICREFYSGTLEYYSDANYMLGFGLLIMWAVLMMSVFATFFGTQVYDEYYFEEYKKWSSENKRKKLERKKYDQSECSICLVPFTKCRSEKTTLNCSHTFHTECIGKWESKTCPICRKVKK